MLTPTRRASRRFGWPRLSWRRLRADQRGVSAVEFALLAPVMILMFWGVVELGQGFLAQRRSTQVTSSLGDLVAQGSDISDAEMSDIFGAASLILSPLSTTGLTMRVTQVFINSKGQAVVDWSEAQNTTKYSPCGKNIVLPTYSSTPLTSNPGDHVIVSQVTYNFVSPVGFVLPNGITFTNTDYFSPRQSSVTRNLAQPASCPSS